MSEVVQPKAIPCFSFKNLCPTFRFKRIVKRENIPSRDPNPILNDKKFIDLKHKDDTQNKKIPNQPEVKNHEE